VPPSSVKKPIRSWIALIMHVLEGASLSIDATSPVKLHRLFLSLIQAA
jgi:hypothetical protein